MVVGVSVQQLDSRAHSGFATFAEQDLRTLLARLATPVGELSASELPLSSSIATCGLAKLMQLAAMRVLRIEGSDNMNGSA